MTPAHLKALFHVLVRAAGGIEAAGAVLDVSPQRVAQLYSPQSPSLPTVLHIVQLEAFVGDAIVTSQLAKLAKPTGDEKSIEDEAFEATAAAFDVHAAVRSGADAKTVESKVVALRKEVEDVTAALGRMATKGAA